MKSFAFLLTLVVLLAVSPANSQISCLRGDTPVLINGSLNLGDVQQAGRITRDGKPSSCAGDTAVLENNTALRRDTHNLVNPYAEDVCVRVEVDFTGCAGNQTQSVAYSSFDPANPAANVIGDMGYSTINKGSYSFPVGPNANFSIVVNEIEANTGCPLYGLKVTYLRNCRQAGFDRTNDGKADPTVYRPSAISKWWTLDSVANEVVVREFGTVGDIVTGGSDYTGDGRSDLSIYRPSTNTWYHGIDQNSPGTNFSATSWGTAGDRVLPGDFDGDGKNDVALWRPSDANFYILRSSTASVQVIHWGTGTDNPTTGDFDGDTLTDIAIVRPTVNGNFWWILQSNYNYGFDNVYQWGLPTDKVVPGDYDGDTVSDLAVWRPSTGIFYVRKSSDLAMLAYKWGANGDIPQPADYDGDMKVDFAVWRPTEGKWYILNSGSETVRYLNWGQQGDQPITAPYRIN